MANLEELSLLAQTMLLQSLQTRAGLDSYTQAGLIHIGLPGFRSILAQVLDASTSDDTWVIQLAIQVVGDSTGEEGIIDIIAGVEAEPQAAILNAIEKWLRFTFPPIRAALSPTDQPDQAVGVTRLVAREDLQWEIFSGNLLVIGTAPDQVSLGTIFSEKKLFPDWVGDPLAERLGAEPRQLHWLRVFIASADGEIFVECQFDNHEWDELDTLLASTFQFPPLASDFLSLKQMLLISPDG